MSAAMAMRAGPMPLVTFRAPILPWSIAPDDEALLQRIRAHNQERLGKLKQPAEILFIDSLPRTATGKVLRRRLRELLPAFSPAAATPRPSAGASPR